MSANPSNGDKTSPYTCKFSSDVSSLTDVTPKRIDIKIFEVMFYVQNLFTLSGVWEKNILSVVFFFF